MSFCNLRLTSFGFTRIIRTKFDNSTFCIACTKCVQVQHQFARDTIYVVCHDSGGNRDAFERVTIDGTTFNNIQMEPPISSVAEQVRYPSNSPDFAFRRLEIPAGALGQLTIFDMQFNIL